MPTRWRRPSKGRLQAKAERAKAEFEKAVQDLASVSQAIEKQTESVARAQEEVRRKVADQEQPRIQDLTGILRTVGVELTEAQQSAVLAKMAAANAATTAAQVPEIPGFDVWMSEKPASREYGPWLPGKEAKSASREARSGLATAARSPARSRSPVAREENEAK